jgi:hypothetical protein
MKTGTASKIAAVLSVAAYHTSKHGDPYSAAWMWGVALNILIWLAWRSNKMGL